jgi:hypothetical protein
MSELAEIEPDNAYRAYLMRQAGNPWGDVADECGYSSAKSAQVAVTGYLQRGAMARSEQWRSEALDLELDRLDTLQLVAWDQAMGGDLKAVETVLKIMSHRAKLLQLDVPVDSSVGTKTLIVMGDSEQYVESLRTLVEGDKDDGA